MDDCTWCGEPNDESSTEFVNPSPAPGEQITKVGHDGCQPVGWVLA